MSWRYIYLRAIWEANNIKKGWMVRAGEGGRLFDDFEKGYVAVGWGKLGNISALDTREKINTSSFCAVIDIPCESNTPITGPAYDLC